jgi:hypothetical protein
VVERNAAPIAPAAPIVAASPRGDVTATDLPMYQSDAIVRRATALQKTREARSLRQTYGGGQS